MICCCDTTGTDPHYYIQCILRRNASYCSGVRSDDYEKLVDREVRAAIQRMQAAEDAKQQGLRTWRLPESLKVCFLSLSVSLPVWPCVHVCLFQPGCGRCQAARPQKLLTVSIFPCSVYLSVPICLSVLCVLFAHIKRPR